MLQEFEESNIDPITQAKTWGIELIGKGDLAKNRLQDVFDRVRSANYPIEVQNLLADSIEAAIYFGRTNSDSIWFKAILESGLDLTAINTILNNRYEVGIKLNTNTLEI
jgi:hypothetical protein